MNDTENPQNEISEPQEVRSKPYVGNAWINFAASTCKLVAIAGPLVGLAFFGSGVTRSSSPVEVRALPRDESAIEGLNEALSGQLPESDVSTLFDTSFDTAGFTLSVGNSNAVEWALSRADALLAGIAVGLIAWLIRKVLITVASGDALAAGNPRRLTLIAATLFGYAVLQGAGPSFASQLAFDRAGLSESGPLVPWTPTLDLFGIIVVPLFVLILAEAFRQGGKLREDAEGLI